MQTNWIGRSEGAEIDFAVAPDANQPGGQSIRVFTTRPDTLFGATFMVLAPEHPLVDELTAPDQQAAVESYRFEARRKSEIERLSTDREKTGVALGSVRDQPDQRRAHPDLDRRLRAAGLRHRRDHGRARPRRARLRVRSEVRFAVRQVIAPRGATTAVNEAAAYVAHTSDEVLVNSGDFSGMGAPRAAARSPSN